MSDEELSDECSEGSSDDGYDYYNSMNDVDDVEMESGQDSVDPEYFSFSLLTLEDVERLLNECVEKLSKATKVSLIILKLYDPSS